MAGYSEAENETATHFGMSVERFREINDYYISAVERSVEKTLKEIRMEMRTEKKNG